MDNNELSVDFITDKKYFIDETINISFRFNKKVRVSVKFQSAPY